MVGVVDDVLADRAFVEQRRTSAAELATLADLQGDAPSVAPHYVANALAAAALARAYGVPPVAVRDGLRAFVPDPHRIADVADVDGVRYVDDSKATNPHAAAASLLAFEHVVWVAGGLLKGADVDDLVARRGRPAAGRGAARRRPRPDRRGPGATRARCPRRRRARARTLGPWTSSCTAAAALARPGDIVLLAPGGRVDGHVPRLRQPAATRSPRPCNATRADPAGPLEHREHHRPAQRVRRPRTAAREPGWRGSLSPRRAVRLAGDHLLPAARRDALLLVIGLVMVLSASAVTSLRQTSSSYTVFFGQLRFAVLGVIAAAVARRHAGPRLEASLRWPCSAGRSCSRCSCSHRWASTSTATATGSPSAACRLQPSEFAKIGARPVGRDRPGQEAAQAGRVRARRRAPDLPGRRPAARCSSWHGHDLGTALVLLSILGGMLFAAGGADPHVRRSPAGPRWSSRAPWSLTSGNRMGRISTWLAGACSDPLGTGFQTCHGTTPWPTAAGGASASARAGRSGSGCPRRTTTSSSRSSVRSSGCPARSWCWACSRSLALACYRLVARTDDLFVRIASAGVMAWIARSRRSSTSARSSACCRSSACRCRWCPRRVGAASRRCSALGMLMSFARDEPGCREALSARVSVVAPVAGRPAGAVRRGGRRWAP